MNGAWEMFGNTTVDLSGYLTDVTLNGTSIVTDGVANIPIAGTSGQKGVISIANPFFMEGSALLLMRASSDRIKNGIDNIYPLVSSKQHESVFYGLAKASGDTTQASSSNPIGTYTDDAKITIRTMLDVPSNSDIPTVNVDDVQINGTSIIENGVANIPKAGDNKLGVVAIKQYGANGIQFVDGNGHIGVTVANSSVIKQGANKYQTITPSMQHEAVFYGLSKVAGVNLINETVTVGEYPDNAKDSIQNMLGITPLIASHETDPFESNHVVSELFIIGGKLYRAKTALTAGEYVNEGTNVEVVSVAGVLDEKVNDVQINGSSIVTDGVANIPSANASRLGVVKVWNTYGLGMGNDNGIQIFSASTAEIKNGEHRHRPIVPLHQHESVFYGLAKASGDTTQSQSNNAVGTYTEEAKSAISDMLNGAVQVSGTDPIITAKSGIRYICGEVLSLNFTPSTSGICDVVFTSGSTPTILTIPDTVRWANDFDPTTLNANTTYELNIMDGLGVACAWT